MMETEQNSTPRETKPPLDKGSLVWYCFAFLGMGTLMPWNSFISAVDYFDSLFPQFPTQFGVSLSNNYANIITLLFSVKFGSKSSIRVRILITLMVSFLSLVIMPVFPYLFKGNTILGLVMSDVFLSGCSSAVLTGSTLGLAALFPPTYTGAVMTGMGIGGIISVAMRIITKLALPATPKGTQISAIIFFSLAAFIMLLCIVAYFLLMNTQYAKFHLTHKEQNQSNKGNLEEQNPLLEDLVVETASIKTVFKKLWIEALIVFGVFVVTLALFPGITGMVPSTLTKLSNDWFQVLMITFFQVGDCAGRFLPKFIALFKRKSLIVATLLRVVFFGLFILCIKIQLHISIPIIIMIIFAFSNGHCSTLAMMYGPSNLQVLSHERELAGVIMTFFPATRNFRWISHCTSTSLFN